MDSVKDSMEVQERIEKSEQDPVAPQQELLVKPPIMKVQEILPELIAETSHAVKWRFVIFSSFHSK